MALSQIPPWLDVRPSDFVKAAQMGAEAGLQVARMNQAAFEAAQNRAARAAEAQAEQELRQFERLLAMQMRAEENAKDRALREAEIGARTAYNLATLGLRERGQESKENIADETLDFRRKQQERLQAEHDLRERSLAFRLDEAKKRLPAEQAMALNDMYVRRRQLKSAMNDPLADPKRLPLIEQEFNVLTQELERFAIPPAPSATPGIPSPAEAASQGGMPEWASGPAATLQGFTPTLPAQEGYLFGGGGGPPEPAPAVPTTPGIVPTLPIAPTPTIPVTPAIGEGGWKTNKMGIRYRPIETSKPRIGWPAQEEPF